MKKPGSNAGDELRPEYDLRQLLPGATRGKYAKRYQSGTNLVLLDPDVHKAFATEKAINDALRLVIELRKAGTAPGRSTPKRERSPRRVRAAKRPSRRML